jgi:hypothetical protein
MESATFDFDSVEEVRKSGLHLYRVKMADAGWIELMAKSRNDAITTAEKLHPEDCAIIATPQDCGSGI